MSLIFYGTGVFAMVEIRTPDKVQRASFNASHIKFMG